VPLRVLRVNQLDASLLDNELTSIIKTSFTKIFSLFRVQHPRASHSEGFPLIAHHAACCRLQPSLIDRFTPELDAFLYFIMYRYSRATHPLRTLRTLHASNTLTFNQTLTLRHGINVRSTVAESHLSR
jgi:hypothetical protein